jgi:hypothetical protein
MSKIELDGGEAAVVVIAKEDHLLRRNETLK